MANAKITYTDGSEDIVPVTMRATCKAEAHALEDGWGTVQQSPVRCGAYAAYAALRMAGRSVPPFDKWLDGVERLDMLAAAPRNDDVEDTDHANPTD